MFGLLLFSVGYGPIRHKNHKDTLSQQRSVKLKNLKKKKKKLTSQIS